MENPLEKHCRIEAKIIILGYYSDTNRPGCINLYDSSYEKLAFKLKTFLEKYNKYQCIVLAGGEILSDEEIEQLMRLSRLE